jgi:hypothetical protein
MPLDQPTILSSVSLFDAVRAESAVMSVHAARPSGSSWTKCKCCSCHMLEMAPKQRAYCCRIRAICCQVHLVEHQVLQLRAKSENRRVQV